MSKRTHTKKETRLVLRCTHCSLNQFQTMSGNCRRCHQPYLPAQVAPVQEELPEVELDETAEQPAIPEDLTPVLPTMVVYETVGETVRQRRLEMGYTQGMLARAMGMNHAGVSDIECGRRRPHISVRARLAKVLQCTPADLSPKPELKAMNWQEALGATMRERREAQGMSMKALSKLSAIPLSTLSRVERGLHKPQTKTLASMAHLLQCPLTDLVQPREWVA